MVWCSCVGYRISNIVAAIAVADRDLKPWFYLQFRPVWFYLDVKHYQNITLR